MKSCWKHWAVQDRPTFTKQTTKDRKGRLGEKGPQTQMSLNGKDMTF